VKLEKAQCTFGHIHSLTCVQELEVLGFPHDSADALFEVTIIVASSFVPVFVLAFLIRSAVVSMSLV